MAKTINIAIAGATPPLCVQFSEGVGAKTERAVGVLVAHDDLRVIASTGFDSPACSLFKTIYDIGSLFCGKLYQAKIDVGDIGIGKDSLDRPYLRVRVYEDEYTVRLEDRDITDLKELFSEIGGC